MVTPTSTGAGPHLPAVASGAGAGGAARSRRGRRAGRWAAVVGAALAVGVAVGWAGHRVLARPPAPVDETAATLVEVTTGSVGASMPLTAVARWQPVAAGTNLAAGTVTAVAVTPGQEVGQGAVLYTVDLRPVVVARGQTPAFRALAPGVRGEDVAQLQTLLTDLGRYRGPVDGRFTAATGAAVRAWQRSLGLAPDGTVQPADVVFVTDLPARVVLDPAVVARGTRLGGGEAVLSRLPASPTFTLPVSATQADVMPAGTPVTLTAPDGTTWQAVSGARTTEADRTVVTLDATGAEPICAAACTQLPVGPETRLAAEVVLVPETSGLRVPSAALSTQADGTVVVVDDDGRAHEVVVRASARGTSVVEGVPEGLLVRVPPDAS